MHPHKVVSRVEGDARLRAAFRALPNRLRRKVNRQAVAAGARVIATEAKKRVPRRTGNLRRSIHSRRDKKSRGKFVVRYLIGAGPRGFYGGFLELGTRYISSRPWLRPAHDTKKREAIAKLGQIWGRGIEREFLKLAGPPKRRR